MRTGHQRETRNCYTRKSTALSAGRRVEYLGRKCDKQETVEDMPVKPNLKDIIVTKRKGLTENATIKNYLRIGIA